MSTTALPLAPVVSGPSRAISIFLREARYEFIRALRNKAFALSVIGFPTMFYVLFGIMNRGDVSQGQIIAKYLLASYAAFGMVGAALFGVGVGLSLERNSGWLELKRASPMPPLAYLLAKCCMAMLFGMLIVSVLCGLGIAFAGVHLGLVEYLRMLGLTVFGVVPFASLGMFLAMLLPANSAPGIVNMIYLPMSFCSGLWIPIHSLPKWLQHVAPVMPTYHLSQLMLGIFGYEQPNQSVLAHWSALFAFTCVFLALGWVAFQRKDGDA